MAIKCPKCQSDNPDDTIYCGKCATPLKSGEKISVTKTLITPKEKLQKGSTIAGKYQILEELGRGGMGVVYKAEDTKLKRTVALKFLPPELTHISEVKERFMREAQAAAALDHTNICTVYEFDEAEEKTFISMAYIEGQSLKKKIESGPLELDEALRIATQVAEGLQEAHKKGVVHRDIKSANIMVTEKGQAKIMDFGLARMTGGTLLTKEGMAMGTIAYMSPEQARGEEVDHRTDIWSFGVVLYEMFSGQLPFKGEQDQAVVYSILNEKPKPITDLRTEIPMSIGQVVSKALEKNLDKRYQQVEELLDDLKSISAGTVPEEIKVRLRKAKLLRRKRAILYAALAGLIIIMAVIALSLFTGRAEAIDPGLSPARSALQYGLTAKGMYDEQLAIQRARIALDPERVAAFERGLAEGGYEGAQRGIADVLAARYGKYGEWVFGGMGIARRYLDAGDNDRAIDWLEKAYEERDPKLPYIGLPFYAPLRSDPRFQDLVRRMKLPEMK